MKAFVFDHSICNGCYNCQIACKDEHCGNEWPPYAKPQPNTGQFWCKLEVTTHGQVPRVRDEFRPVFGAQNEALREYAPEVIMERGDNLIVIDPEKAQGRKDIAEKIEGVYWNEELNIPQGCTGCAHLVDAGEVPHCVDLCAFGALKFVDIEEGDELIRDAETVPGSEGHVYYLNMPHLFIGGGVYDPEVMEVVEGARVVLSGPDGLSMETSSDEFGDFWFRRIDAGEYHLAIEAEGFERVERGIKLEKSLNLGDIALEK